MEQTNSTLVIGSGHLAHRVAALVEKNNYKVMYLENIFEEADKKSPTLDKITKALKEINLEALKMIYLLDDKDERNLELIIALIELNKNLHITASFFNENIAPHLQARHPNIRILNPAKIASSTFADALYEPLQHSLSYTPVKHVDEKKHSSDMLMKILVLGFFTTALFATIYFHFYTKMRWINSLYFVVTTIATVGYGDISLLHASTTAKIVDIVLMFNSILFPPFIFALITNYLLKKRNERSLGRKKYHYKNHVVICGLGRLGYFVSEELLKRGEKILIIEQNEQSENIDHFRNQGVGVYIGNARLPRVLHDVNVVQAKAVISVINNDMYNLEIGLNARSFQPDLRLILRIFDDSMAKMIKENLDIHLALSMSAVADEKFYNLLEE